MRAADAARHVVEALAGGAPAAEVVVVASGSPRVPAGERMVVWEDRTAGTLGSPDVDAEAIRAAREALRSRAQSTTAIADETGAVTIFVEPHHPPDELVIVGAGHIARPLCRVGAMLGYRVVVLDDRPGFATQERFPEATRLVRADFSDPFREVQLGRGTHLVLVTRGHKYDYDALRDVLMRGADLAYIGMVGSQRRVRAALEQLHREGIPRDGLERIFAPIGLDIEAETPEELAISIAAELIRVRRGGTGASLRDSTRVMQRWIGAAERTGNTNDEKEE
ncbi:MAG: XdhC family protein [Gemmatimonadota bacterium]